MDMANQAQEQEKDLFKTLNKGDSAISRVQKKAIILIGLTRIGKSTVYNWILKNVMIGRGTIHSFYQNVQGDAAQTANSYVSMTLAPNIRPNFAGQVSLIDMAGFKDTRDFVGTVGVSYFLKSIFDNVREAKFIIVFSEQDLFAPGGDNIILTINNFIELFRIDLMTEANADLKKTLFDSIGVVITRSRRGDQHYEALNEVKQHLKDARLNVTNRQLIVEVLDSILTCGRMAEFKAAVKNRNPEECTFIDMFDNRFNWKYFNLDVAEQNTKSSIIRLPFQKKYLSMTQKDRESLNTEFNKAIAMTQSFAELLRSFMITMKKNWKTFIANWEKGFFQPNHMALLSGFWEDVNNFIRQNDLYGSKDYIQSQFTANYEPISLVKAIKTVLDIYDSVDSIMIQGENSIVGFHKSMEIFSTGFNNIIDCLKRFCNRQEEEESIEILRYMLLTAFKEFSKLFDLNQELIYKIQVIIPSELNNVCGEQKKVLLQRYLKKLNSYLLVKCFPNLQQLQDYEKSIFFEYEKQDHTASRDGIFIKKYRCSIEDAKADILNNNGKSLEALQSYIKSYRNYNGLGKQLQTEDLEAFQQEPIKEEEDESILNADPNVENPQEQLEEKAESGEQKQALTKKLKVTKDEEIRANTMKKRRLIKKIGKILNGISEADVLQFKTFALNLYNSYNMVEEVCTINNSLIQMQIPAQKKCKILDAYVQHCIKYGRIEQALILLQKKMSIEEEYEGYSDTIQQIIDLQSSPTTKMNETLNTFKNLAHLQIDQKSINVQLEGIEKAIKTILSK